ncbi:imidazolonepropionase-like domain-containing protein [Streptomyces sp. URMC 123]|uniref:imidazolonepropionase-like domain-containing protein n=1 Tax=Streptomyces sp. URMC 123 TaxID=3423403 RepID=UPI003F1C6EBF
MLTIHTAARLRRTLADPAPLSRGAVAVEGDRVAAIGPLDELRARFPAARLREWPGTLGPALLHDGPLPPAETPRERVHAVLKRGAAAVLAEHVAEPALRAAAERAGLALPVRPAPVALVESGRADLAAFDEDGHCVATVLAGRLVHRRR